MSDQKLAAKGEVSYLRSLFLDLVVLMVVVVVVVEEEEEEEEEEM
jgi:hypothetical protein